MKFYSEDPQILGAVLHSSVIQDLCARGLGCELLDGGSVSSRQSFFSSLLHPNWFWGPPSSISDGYHVFAVDVK